MRTGRTGFTLMELLVVIALIAIIAALVFPVFVEARTAAREASCKSNLKELGAAIQLYKDDWGASVLSVTASRKWGDNGWMEKIYKYHRNMELYRCPSRNINFAYSMNAKMASETAARPVKPSAFIVLFEAPGSGSGMIDLPGGDVAPCGDCNMTNVTSNGRIQSDGVAYGGADILTPGSSIQHHQWDGNNKPEHYNQLFFPGPHSGASNVLFFDGHVRRFTDWRPGAMTFDPTITGYTD